MRDEVMDLHAQGLTAREISERTGRTRNAIIGYIWRVKRRGPPRVTKPRPTPAMVDEAVRASGGNLSAAARELNVCRKTLWDMGYRGLPFVKINRAKDPETYSLILAIDMSGLSDSRIAELVEMGGSTIRNWRYGKKSASPFLAQCVRTVLAQNAPGY